jgi:hypothetical protein
MGQKNKNIFRKAFWVILGFAVGIIGFALIFLQGCENIITKTAWQWFNR